MIRNSSVVFEKSERTKYLDEGVEECDKQIILKELQIFEFTFARITGPL